MADEVAAFISYRRDDSAGHAGRLFDHLSARFGAGCVFMDVDSITPGADFADVIATALDRCRAAVVVIGPRWASERLHDVNDFVRIEVEAALTRRLRVLPVLVHGAKMPAAEELPQSLRPLTRLHALELTERRWSADVLELAELLRGALEDVASGKPPSPFSPDAPRERLPTGAAVPLPGPLVAARRGLIAGRADVLVTLEDHWRSLVDRSPQLLVIGGEPGIGKTRLSAEFAAQVHADGGTVLFGRCDADAPRAYQPFAEALRGYLRACDASGIEAPLGRLAPALAPLVPELGTDGPSAFHAFGRQDAFVGADERQVVLDAAVDFLTALAGDAQVLLVVDDLHWATAATSFMLRHVVRASDAAVLVLATYRDTELEAARAVQETVAELGRNHQVTRLSLSGLDEAAVAACVAEAGITSGDERDALARELHGRTEGNPLFVAELVRQFAETGDRSPIVSEGLLDAIGRRLASLPEPAQRALRVASVAGLTFTLPMLETVPAAAEDTDALLDAMDAAVEARVLVEERDPTVVRYAFTHALIRQVLYDGLSLARRARLHGAVAAALEARPGPEDERLPALAHHWAAAAPAGGTDKAVHYAQLAARAALDRYAIEESAAIVERALEVLAVGGNPDARRADLLVLRAEVHYKSGEWDIGRGVALQAAEEARAAGAPDALARAADVYLWDMPIGMAQSEWPALVEEALTALGDNHPALRATLLAQMPFLRPHGDGYDSAALRQEALEVARASGDAMALNNALFGVIQSLWGTAAVDEQLALIDELDGLAPAAAEQRGQELLPRRSVGRHGLINRPASALGAVADPDAGRHPPREAGGHATKPGPSLLDPEVAFFRLRARLELGDANFNEDLVDLGERMKRLPHAMQAAYGTPVWTRAAVALLRGRFDVAEELIDHVMAFATDRINVLNIGVAQLFVLRREQGRLSEVEPLAEGALEALPGLAGFRAALALARLDAGDLEGAGERFEALAERGFADVPRDMTWTGSLFLLAETCSALGDRARAATLARLLEPHAGHMVVIAAMAACPSSVDRCLGQLAATMGDRSAAMARYESGLALEERLGAAPLAARTRYWYARLLLESGKQADAGRATGLLEEGLATARTLGMVTLAEQMDGLRQLRP